MNILVTAGNTQTQIDRVRCITNIFSGRTGARVAAEADSRGHTVTLLTYDVPRLGLGKEFSKFIPILGPLGAEFKFEIGAGIGINVGYDTFGFETGDPLRGFFFSTPRITLEDGQVWEETEHAPGVELASGETVTIKRGMFGSFFMSRDHGIALRVKRFRLSRPPPPCRNFKTR